VSDDRTKPTRRVGPEELGRLLDAHGPGLTLYARQLCSTPEDAVQEAFIELARQRELPAEPIAWLMRVVRNKALTASRAQQRRERHEEMAGRERGVDEARAASFAAGGADSLDAMQVAAALAELAIEDREIVVAHLWNGLTFREIGALLDTTDSTAHRRYRAALEAMRERLARQKT
jgi:RNA polymerase sigma factor (sigma-70 family)